MGVTGPILIWGAGAIGGTLGAAFARAGHDVDFVDADPDHVAAMNARGLRIDGPLWTGTVSAPAALPADVGGTYERIFLCVKAQHTAGAARALAPHLAERGYVVSAQNGLNERIIADAVGAARTIGCFVNFGADYLEPGVVHFSGRGAVVVGELDGATTDRIRDLHALMLGFEPDAILTENIWGYLWGKMIYGALLFATALTNHSIADVLADAEARPFLVRLGQEVGAVAAVRRRAHRGLQRLRPRRLRARRRSRGHRAFLRRHGRPQPPLGEVALRHLARPRRTQAQDRGRGAARPDRRHRRRERRADPADRPGHGADRRDRDRPPPARPHQSRRPRQRGRDVNLVFEGRTVIVTGAGHGIGRAIAVAFATRGARLHATDINAEGLAETARLCGDGTTTLALDVSDRDAVQAAVPALDADILVNCAGGVRGQVGRPIEEITAQDWRAIFDANLTGTFFMTQAVAPAMKAHGHGRIVNISSGAGRTISLTGIQAYASAKAGQIGLTRQLAHELGPFGITVNCIAPGFVRSNPTTEKQWDALGAEGQAALIRGIALRKLGTPDDIAHAVLFFASDYAGWITGETLGVDGGK